MKAARWYKAKDIRIDNIEEPQVTPGRVKIQVEWTVISSVNVGDLAVVIFMNMWRDRRGCNGRLRNFSK